MGEQRSENATLAKSEPRLAQAKSVWVRPKPCLGIAGRAINQARMVWAELIPKYFICTQTQS